MFTNVIYAFLVNSIGFNLNFFVMNFFLGFKRRGMLVNHLAKRHPEIPYNTVPELNMPIVKTSKDYYCQYCEKVYKSSSKRKAHIIKNHPGKNLLFLD